MTSASLRPLALILGILALAAPAAAQDPDEAFESARFRFGAIRFTPALEITSLGYDSNVFNEADNPRSDTTAAIGPTVQLWMRPAGTRFRARVGAQYLYFKTYDNERAWNTSNEARWDLPLGRLTPFAAGSYVNSRERLGYEIDSRSRREDDAVSVGSAVRFSAKTGVVVSVRRFNARYDERESFLGAVLADQLNRREESLKVQFRYVLTPLTTFVVDTDAAQDRFTVNSLRDSDSVRVLPGFELKPLALISGRVFVGYRQFDPKSADLPDYRGVVAAVDATYIRASTRFVLRVDRDLAYSYDPARPYYALVDFGLTVTQRVTHAWELVARGSRQILSYRRLASLDPFATGPSDRAYTLGGGLGHRVGETFRLGLDANYSTRRSEIAGRRDYEGLRLFGSITYGIPQ